MIFETFSDLNDEFKKRDGTALLFEDRNFPENRGFLSYRDFASLITASVDSVRKDGNKIDFIRASHTPDSLVTIFSDLIAGCTIVLLDHTLPPLREQTIRKRLSAKLADLDNADGEGRLIFFTSGTTHSSKAVVLSAKALLHASWRGQECLPIGREDTLLSILPLSHVFGFVCTMLWGLCYGATVALSRGVRHLMDDPKFFRPTVLPLVPTLANAMTRFGCYNPELKVILIGAAPLGQNELDAMKEKTSAHVYTGYGLTETASGVAITEDLDHPYSLRVCPGVEIKLAEDSEILLKTDSLLLRYIKLLPELEKVKETHEEVHRKIQKDLNLPVSESELHSEHAEPLFDEEGFFHTGDIGVFDKDGRLHISGRKKDILVLPDGTKVFCPEYEKALSDAMGTDELAIAERNGRPVLLVSDKIKKETAESVVEKLNQHLSRSQQIAGILYIDMPLPRTVTGKLKRWMIEQAIRKEDYSTWKQ